MSFNLTSCCTNADKLGVRGTSVTGQVASKLLQTGDLLFLVLDILFFGDFGHLVLLRISLVASLHLVVGKEKFRKIHGEITHCHLEHANDRCTCSS